MQKTKCEYFALCENEATHIQPHPILVDGVPTCDRCAQRMGLTIQKEEGAQ